MGGGRVLVVEMVLLGAVRKGQDVIRGHHGVGSGSRSSESNKPSFRNWCNYDMSFQSETRGGSRWFS